MKKSLLYLLLFGITLIGSGCFHKKESKNSKKGHKKHNRQKQLDEGIEEFELMDDIDENFFNDQAEGESKASEQEKLSWMDIENKNADHEILFDFNKSEIRKDQQKKLDQSIKWAKEQTNKGKKVVVEGHADAIGARDYNLALSERRAKSISKKVASAGVPKKQLMVIGRGQEILRVNAPLTPTDQQPNRRCVLYEVY